MRILPFRRAAASQCDAEAQDWSQQELADFYRAHRLLVENGAGIGIDRGLSDSGEPWAVFYDLATQDAFLHVARIDRSCLLICDSLGIRLTAPTVADLIARFETEVRRLLNLHTQGSAAIILHPASRAIMSIAAVFLLFKFENAAAAHWKGGSGEPGGDFSTRKLDSGIFARVQSAVARLYDSMEAPAAVAALAGVILSVELAGVTSHRGGEQVAQDDHHAAHQAALSHEMAEQADTRTDIVQLHEAEDVQTVTIHAKSLQPTGPVAVVSDTKDAMIVGPEVAMHKAAHMLAVAGGEPTGSNAPVLLASMPKPTPATPIAVDQAVTVGAEAPSHTQAYVTVQSLAQIIGAGDERAFLTQALPPPPPPSSAPEPAADSGVGFSYTTALTGQPLYETLSQFIETMGGYEIELHGTSVMIEQDNIETLSAKDIGIWTNMMPDGSDISVIGQAALVHEVVGMFA